MAATTKAPQREVIPGTEELLAPALPPALVFESLNAPQTITVTDAKVRQDRDFDSGELKTWSDGSPLMILVVIGTDEEGKERSLYVKGRHLTGAFRVALREAGLVGVAKGDVITVAWTGEEEVIDPKTGKAKKGLNPAKLYTVTVS